MGVLFGVILICDWLFVNFDDFFKVLIFNIVFFKFEF